MKRKLGRSRRKIKMREKHGEEGESRQKDERDGKKKERG